MFQVTIVKKYISSQNRDELTSNWEIFKNFFNDIGNQSRIRELKEEQFQEGFLDKLFVEVFGYIKKPLENYNLVPELKNPNNSRKVDGGLIFNDVVKCVIELKGTNTTDLGKVEEQAFSYKNNQPGCKYVVTSNFEKLRFYIENTTEFLEFNLFELSQDEFDLMYLCLSSKSVENDIPLKLKSESVSQEDLITKKLYKDYSIFKRELFNNLTELNQGYDKLLLFKKSQKLLDRFLFLFFGEDKFLLPPNSVRLILDDWKDLLDKDVEISLYDRFKKYFGYLNTGFKGKRYDVFPYNGGLFKPDDILDNILIDDELLYNHTKKLSEYDFESEVDVNILGHIFENSLNEIEEISNELINGEVVNSTSKRKKDGVFYTPKYITKYIVDNTIGKLCDEKKNELQINDEDYITDKKRIKKTIKGLSDKLNEYRNWLLELTICDPSCGSGAFLNQSLDFLIKEHRYVDELQSKLFGDSLVLSDIENSILENNLFGVDINAESVEITKLSLWLRTAQPNRKLNSLSSNIKCGNSLIDEPIEGVENYFKWEEEFPKVFEKGGFDVVIGNPPYVRQELIQEYSEYLKKYKVYSGKGDLFTFFFEKGHEILKSNGYLCFISSGKFFEASYGKTLVDFLISNFKFEEIINFDDLEVFEGISAYPLIFNGRKKIENNYCFNYCFVPDCNFSKISDITYNLPFIKISNADFIKNKFKFYSPDVSELFNKLNDNSVYLKDINCLPLVGVKTGFNDGFITESKDISFSKPYVFGRNIKRYLTPDVNLNIIFPYDRNDTEYELISEDCLGTGITFLENERDKLEKRSVIKDGIKNGAKKWYEYQQINKKLDFNSKYIIYPNVSLGTNFTFSKGNVVDMTGFIIPSDDKFLLSLLNSKVCQFVMRKTAITRRGNYQEYKLQYLEKIPLKMISVIEKEPFEKKVDEIILLTDELQTQSNKFQRTLQRNFEGLEVLPRKIQEWYLLSFNEFLKELSKKKVKLSLEEEGKWEDFFNSESKRILEIKDSIEKTNKEIDSMVYKLYNLNDDEIDIIESSL